MKEDDDVDDVKEDDMKEDDLLVGASDVLMSASAVASAAATMVADPRRQADEDRYRERVKACVPKPGGHTQLPLSAKDVGNGCRRLYTVTTMAASVVYGGTRTVVVCDSFERAKEIVERNEGDIWETTYQLAVIEAVAANWLYHYMDERYWYRWNDELRAYESIETPPGFENMIGFGIG